MEWVVLMLSFMRPEWISVPKSFVAKVARNNNTIQMVCFNMILYGIALAFLSTNFATMSNCYWIGSICSFVLAFFHHCLQSFFKFLKVPRIVSRNGQCSIFSKIVDISVGCLPVNSSFWNCCWWECWRQRLFNFFICFKPFNWNSSAIANMKETRPSWKTFASPW